MNPRYPVYIISKGRADTRLTAIALEYMRVPFLIVVEPQEYTKYAAVINSKKILVTPFKNLGQGSIPVRNFVWDHSNSIGAKRHWIMDDNIRGFMRLNNNLKVAVNSGNIFCAMEDFVDRYTNVALAGPQYDYFIPRKARVQPFSVNTRIYSCILIKNDLPHKWRGKYNEDTDLSIRVLKDNYCTILFNAFLSVKGRTLTMKGGNAEIYKDGRKAFAESLQKQHPDIVKVVTKFNRPHHEVDYSGFKDNELKFKRGFKMPEGINDYNMELIHLNESITIGKPQ